MRPRRLSLLRALLLAAVCVALPGCPAGGSEGPDRPAEDEPAEAAETAGSGAADAAPTGAPDDAGGTPPITTRDAAPPSDVRGIDVSHYSGTVDWDAVREAGVRFAYLKATEGVDAADPSFPDHWRELEGDPAILRGAYHFYVTEDDPEEQARFFLSTVTLRPGDLPPVVDVEILGRGTEPGLSDRLATFLGIVERETGARPIVYTAPHFWDAHLTDRFGDYPLWVAEYEVDEPVTPEGWRAWTLWQWEQDAPVPGVEKGADLSHLHPELDLESLRIGKGGG